MSSRLISRRMALWTAILLSVAALWPFGTVRAQSPSGGVTVSPALLEIDLAKGVPEVERAFRVRNDNVYPVRLQAELAGLEQIGTRLVPAGQAEPVVAQAVSVQPGDFELAPGSAANVSVRVRNNAELPPGGHYASILLRFVSGDSVRGSQSVNLNASISVGLFITKLDGAMRKLDARIVDTNGWIFALPTTVDIRVLNQGNVLAVPRGRLDIKLGEALYRSGLVNQESIGILPGKEVQLRTPLKTQRFTWLPGTYTISAVYRAEGEPSTQTLTKLVWYIPPYLLMVLLLLAGVFVLVRRKRTRASARADISVSRTEEEELSNSGIESKTKHRQAKRITVRDAADGEKIPVRKK